MAWKSQGGSGGHMLRDLTFLTSDMGKMMDEVPWINRMLHSVLYT